MRDSGQVQLARDAERLAALFESARARSRMTGVSVRWRVHATGFKFEGLAAQDLPDQWLDADTTVAAGIQVWLGPEPIIDPQEVVLVSRRHPHRSVRLATDGVRPFTVQ